MCKTSFLYYWCEREWSEWSETLKNRDGRNEKKRTIVNSANCAFLWGYAYTCILDDVILISMLEHSFFYSNKCGTNLSSLTITNTWIIRSTKMVANGKWKSRFHWVRFCDISDDAQFLHSNFHLQVWHLFYFCCVRACVHVCVCVCVFVTKYDHCGVLGNVD